jgi:hypothetical protein
MQNKSTVQDLVAIVRSLGQHMKALLEARQRQDRKEIKRLQGALDSDIEKTTVWVQATLATPRAQKMVADALIEQAERMVQAQDPEEPFAWSLADERRLSGELSALWALAREEEEGLIWYVL